MWYEQGTYFGEGLVGVLMGNLSIHVELRPIQIEQKNTGLRNTHRYNFNRLFFWIGLELSIPVLKIYDQTIYCWNTPLLAMCFSEIFDMVCMTFKRKSLIIKEMGLKKYLWFLHNMTTYMYNYFLSMVIDFSNEPRILWGTWILKMQVVVCLRSVLPIWVARPSVFQPNWEICCTVHRVLLKYSRLKHPQQKQNTPPLKNKKQKNDDINNKNKQNKNNLNLLWQQKCSCNYSCFFFTFYKVLIYLLPLPIFYFYRLKSIILPMS